MSKTRFGNVCDWLPLTLTLTLTLTVTPTIPLSNVPTIQHEWCMYACTSSTYIWPRASTHPKISGSVLSPRPLKSLRERHRWEKTDSAHNIEETDYSDCINIVGNIGVRQRFKVRIRVRARVKDRIRWDGKCDVVTDYSHGLQSRITVTDYSQG